MSFPNLPASPTIPTAGDVFRQAAELGVRLSVSGGFLDWEAAQEPPEGFLAVAAAVKTELIEILRGDRRRSCGDRVAWPWAGGVVYADFTSE
jgi:hypothetical protein